jgi:two-component system chemotaxis response regulator CheY
MFAIVEDCITTSALLSTIIQTTTGNDTLEYGSAEPFMRDLKIHKFPLTAIFIDINLPNMNGIDLIAFIQSFEGYAETPIIVCSSTASRETIIKALKAGASNFLMKPFSKENILSILTKLGAVKNKAS